MFDKAELVRIVWAQHVEFVQFEMGFLYNYAQVQYSNCQGSRAEAKTI